MPLQELPKARVASGPEWRREKWEMRLLRRAGIRPHGPWRPSWEKQRTRSKGERSLLRVDSTDLGQEERKPVLVSSGHQNKNGCTLVA